MNDSDPSHTTDTPPGQRQVTYWLLFQANRWVIAGGMACIFFLILVGLGSIDPSLRTLMQRSDEVKTTAQAYITALITGATLVVAINQLVISQELGSLGEQRERMVGVLDFLQTVEDRRFTSVSPGEPAIFLRTLIMASIQRSQALETAVANNDSETLRAQVAQFNATHTRHATAVSDQLQQIKFGQFEAMRVALDFNYTWALYQVRRMRAEHMETLNDEEKEAFDEMVAVLALFGPARENVKTLYFRRDLIKLTRSLLYTAFPAILIALAVSFYLDAGDFPGALLGVDNMVWVVSIAFAGGLFPFFLLAAYIIRIGTVAERTLTIGPFVLDESQKRDAIDWRDDRPVGETSGDLTDSTDG